MNISLLNKSFVIKTVCQLILTVFALMPCSIKNSFLSENIQVAKTLNVSKVTNSFSNCYFSFSTEKNQKCLKEVKKLKSTSVNSYFKIVCNFKSFKYYQSNAPPYYILYKQLKVASVS